MDVKIKGSNNRIKLNKNDFIHSGGEGYIYLKNDTIFKIYIDPQKTIPYSKIKELSLIHNKNVIKPQNIVLDTKDNPIGYTTSYVSDTYILCQLFPKAFRDRENLENDIMLKLISKLRNIIEDIHKANILIVDLNEMNFLVNKKFDEIYAIDVDSYQTPSFPATAIMESIRDRHSKTFNELTDWFSFGILSFQMFLGIHPYKGHYDLIRFPQDKAKELDERMKANIPIFHKDVKFPSVCLPFDIIPQIYKNWYKAIFYEGKRLPPPIDIIETIIMPTITTEILGDKDFNINKILEYSDKIVKYFCFDGNNITLLINNDVFVNKEKMNVNHKYFAATQNNKIICAKIENNYLKLYNITDKKEILCNIIAEEIMSYNENIFIKNKDSISEIEFIELGKNTQAVPHTIANVMERATQIYDGTIIQNILGRFVVSIFPSKRKHYQLNIPELDHYKVIDAKYDNKVLIIIGSKNGEYDKFIFKLDNTFSKYSLRKESNINYCGINFVVLDNGTVVHIDENEKLELFSNKIDSFSVKIIESSLINGNMKLFKDGTKVLFSDNNKLYQMKMK